MKPKKTNPDTELRRLAEKRLKDRRQGEIACPGSEKDKLLLLHELQVHQIELEMQNEELQQSRQEVERLLEEYTGLYDFAPLGYFSLNRGGEICCVNLPGAALLEVERSRLVKRRFELFVSEDSRPACAAFLNEVFAVRKKASCEIVLLRDRSQPFWAYLEATASEDGQECRVAVMDIDDRKRMEEALNASRHILEGIVNAIPVRVFWKDRNLVFQGCNAALARDAGFSDPKDIIGKDDYQMSWRDQAELYRGDDRQVIESGQSKLLIEEPQTTPEGKTIALLTSKVPLRGPDGEITGIIGTYMDITERKQLEAALKRIEWLLNPKTPALQESYSPAYGDLVPLNTCRLIYNAVGEDMLASIIGDYLDLLETSGAVYEKNGDYALGIFSSGWCRFMDAASRQLCDTTDNRTALAGGKWLCHESCWENASKTSIETGQPADIECAGGIHLYAVPIRAGNEIVGALNFGYGDPPRDPAKLRELAAKYDVNFEELRQYAEAYESRPPFIIALAKRRAQVSAQLIGEIIERNQAEEVLQKSEEKYRSLLRAVVDPILMVDARGEVLLVNEAKSVLLNKPASEILNHNIRQLMPEETAAAWMEKIKEVLASGDPGLLMNWQKERYFESIFSPITSPGGDVYAVTIISRDYTDRKLDQEEIEKLAKFPSENPNPVLRVTKDGIIIYCNKAGDYLLQAWKCRIGEALPEEWRARVGEVLHSGEIVDSELEVNDKIFSLTVAPIVESEYVNIYGNDITARKKAEEDLRQSEEQLRQGQKMEAVGRLAGGIAHDFNNLLTAISGFSDLTLDQLPADSPLRDDVETIKKAAFRAAALTRQLLAFSRKQALQPQILNLNKTIDNLDKMLRRIIGENIQIVTRFAEKISRVKADPGQIEQVIMNLVVNARDAMPDGGTITISTADIFLDQETAEIIPDASPGRFVRLSLEDTGIGIDPETSENIFEPFFTTKIIGEGTGLGLSTVYGIVKQHGGWINVYSEPGEGSVFNVYLPAFGSSSDGEREETDSLERPRGDGEKILVVEDEVGVRNFIARTLRRYGYDVFEAATISEGERIFSEHPDAIDLLFTDIVLTDGSGFHLAQQLRERQPDLAVLLCSGYSEGHFRWTTEDKETFRLLQKPCGLYDLLAAVKDLLLERSKKPGEE